MTLVKNSMFAATLIFSSMIAMATDVSFSEAIKLRDAGTIKPFETLEQLAIQQHPGSTIKETELENIMGRYVYQLELQDVKGIEWDIELDAVTGEILKNQQDN